MQPQYQPAFSALQPGFQPFNFSASLQQQPPQDYSSEARWKGKWRQGAETQEDLAAFDRAFEAHAEEVVTRTTDHARTETSTLNERAFLDMRRELQTAFLERSVSQGTKNAETMDSLLSDLERNVGATTDPMIRHSRINKLLYLISTDESKPMADEYHLQTRAGELLRKYRHIMGEEIGARVDRVFIDRVFAEEHQPVIHPAEQDLEQEEHTQDIEQAQAQEQTQQPRDPPIQADEDLARTAGELLANLADNESSKFRESSFLSLMRRLRDREVHVRGDKMVDVDVSPAPLKHPRTSWCLSEKDM